MNQKFTIQGVEFNHMQSGASFKMGEITIEVTDLNLVEYIQLVKAVPSLVKEVGTTIQELIERHETFALEHAQLVADFERRMREQMTDVSFGFQPFPPFGECDGCDADGDDDIDYSYDEPTVDDDGINDDELQATKFADKKVKRAEPVPEDEDDRFID